jgi:hypothetical protein
MDLLVRDMVPVVLVVVPRWHLAEAAQAGMAVRGVLEFSCSE